MRGRPWTADDASQLRRLCKAGLNDCEIAQRMGRHRDVIRAKRRAIELPANMSPSLVLMMRRINLRRKLLQFQ